MLQELTEDPDAKIRVSVAWVAKYLIQLVLVAVKFLSVMLVNWLYRWLGIL